MGNARYAVQVGRSPGSGCWSNWWRSSAARRGRSCRGALQLAPGQSLFVLLGNSSINAEPWSYCEPAGSPVAVGETWRVQFIEGGPTLPLTFETSQPTPWTDTPDESAKRFAGTARYSTTFTLPAGNTVRWQLDLGEVLGSACVRVNGQTVATLIAPPYRVVLNQLADTENLLEVEVTGVAANRIRYLDQQGVNWRIFDDINLVNIDYKPFDASDWPVRPLGLRGPVTLAPLASAGGG